MSSGESNMTVDRIRWWHVLIGALSIRIAILSLDPFPPAFVEPLKAGITLATKGYLGDPFSVPTGVTAHMAPAYPAIVAAVRLLTGSSSATLTALYFLMAVVSSLNVAALIPLSRSLRLPAGAGLLAALMFLIPAFTWVELGAQFEAPLTVSVLLAVLWLVIRTFEKRSPTWMDGALLGVAVGAGAYVTPVVAPTAAFACAAGWAVMRTPLRRVLVVAAAAAPVFLSVIAPYTVRNRIEMGGWFFMRDDLGLELSLSNADNARPTELENSKPGGTMDEHPFGNESVARYVRRVGEVAYNRSLLQRTLGWIRAHPRVFAILTVKRAGYLLVPASPRWYQRVFGGLMTALFLLGAAMLWRSQLRLPVRCIASAVIGYSFIYTLVQSDARYVYPLYWMESLVAGSVLAMVVFRAGSVAFERHEITSRINMLDRRRLPDVGASRLSGPSPPARD